MTYKLVKLRSETVRDAESSCACGARIDPTIEFQKSRIDTSHLRTRVWKPALEKAGLKYREMKQTRHSFATNALSCGENPLWIANVMGHRDTDMIIRVYSKYIENAGGVQDGNYLNDFYKGNTEKDG